jgi:hypothetical protein
VERNYLEPYLKFVYDNKSVFKATIKNPTSMNSFNRYLNLQRYIFEPVMERFQIPEDMQKYWTAYYLKGIWAIIEEC